MTRYSAERGGILGWLVTVWHDGTDGITYHISDWDDQNHEHVVSRLEESWTGFQKRRQADQNYCRETSKLDDQHVDLSNVGIGWVVRPSSCKRQVRAIPMNPEFAVFTAIKAAIDHAEEVTRSRSQRGFPPSTAERVGFFVTSLRSNLASYDSPAKDLPKDELSSLRALLLRTEVWSEVGVLRQEYNVDYSTVNRLANKAMSDLKGQDVEIAQSMKNMQSALQDMNMLVSQVATINNRADVVVNGLCSVAELLAPIG